MLISALQRKCRYIYVLSSVDYPSVLLCVVVSDLLAVLFP